jgi:hypothetical protein
MAAVAVAIVVFKLQRQPAFIDYLVMWTGGGLAHVDPGALYDVVRVDRAQAWLLGARAHDRPFPYPPSSLLIFGPLARLPFWASAWVWFVGGAAVFLVGLRRFAGGRRPIAALALSCVLPGVAWAAVSGQCAFAVGGLAMLAIVGLERRPLAAGVAFGLAVMLKPTLLLMAPVALIAGGYWRALWSMAATCAVALALSIVVDGVGPWIAWLTVSPGYLARIAVDPRYRTAIIAPTGLAIRLGVTGWPLAACRFFLALLGAAMAALGFRAKGGDRSLRLVALVGGSLLAAPYAMNYETTLLAPAAALTLVDAGSPRRLWLAAAAYVALAFAGLPNVGAFALPVFLILAIWPSLQGRFDFARNAVEPHR